MIEIITSMLPILTGFIARLVADGLKQKSEQQKLMIQAMNANNKAIDSAREFAQKESPYSAFTRRVIFFMILAFIAVYVLAPVLFDIPTVIPVIDKGISVLGLQITEDTTNYITVEGMVKYNEIFDWASNIVAFYVGSQIKGR
jgi:hypothetical protein